MQTTTIKNREVFSLISKKDYAVKDIVVPDGVIEVYKYHPETHEYCGSFNAYYYGTDVICDDISCCTLIEPKCKESSYDYWSRSERYGIEVSKIKQTKVFDTENNIWIYVEDHRHFFYKYDEEKHEFVKVDIASLADNAFRLSAYNLRTYKLPLEGDTPDSEGRIMKKLGPLPDGAVIAHLPNINRMRNELLKKIYKSFNDHINKLFKSTMCITDEDINMLEPSYFNFYSDNIDFNTLKLTLEETYLASNNYINLYNIYTSAIQQTATIQEHIEPYSPIGVIVCIHNFKSFEETMEYMKDVSNKYYLAQMSFAVIKRVINKEITTYKDIYEMWYQEFNGDKSDKPFEFEKLIEKFTNEINALHKKI